MYSQLPSNGDGSQQVAGGKRLLKIGLAVGGGSCLLLLAIAAVSLSTPTPTAEPMSLFGMPTAARSPLTAQGPSPVLAGGMGALLPGPSPWKELALAALEGTNQCDRDVSAKAQNKVREVVASMDGRSRAMVAQVTAAAQTKVQAMTVQDMAGVAPPLGFFDPVGFSADIPEGKLLFFREAELKHGRICMLAFLGILIGESFHPFFPGFPNVPHTLPRLSEDFFQTSINQFWPALAAAIAIPEFASLKYYDNSDQTPLVTKKEVPSVSGLMMKTGREAGDLGWDPLGLKPKDAKGLKEIQTKEILNGRLAMISVMGIIAQEIATQKPVFGPSL